MTSISELSVNSARSVPGDCREAMTGFTVRYQLPSSPGANMVGVATSGSSLMNM